MMYICMIVIMISSYHLSYISFSAIQNFNSNLFSNSFYHPISSPAIKSNRCLLRNKKANFNFLNIKLRHPHKSRYTWITPFCYVPCYTSHVLAQTYLIFIKQRGNCDSPACLRFLHSKPVDREFERCR